MREQRNGWQFLMATNHAPVCPPDPPESVVCSCFERCKDCPYPAHGFICWNNEGCIRTLMEKIQEREMKRK